MAQMCQAAKQVFVDEILMKYFCHSLNGGNWELLISTVLKRVK